MYFLFNMIDTKIRTISPFFLNNQTWTIAYSKLWYHICNVYELRLHKEVKGLKCPKVVNQNKLKVVSYRMYRIPPKFVFLMTVKVFLTFYV